jgi:pyruvate,water dikinase
MEQELDAVFRTLSESARGGGAGLAVRASALVADTAVARDTGLSSTILGVTSREALGRAIRETWALAVSETVLSSVRTRKLRDLAMAVVLEPVAPSLKVVRLYTDGRAVLGADGAPPGAEGLRVVVALPMSAPADGDLDGAEVVYLGRDGAVRARRWPDPPAPGVVRREGAPPPLDAKRLSELSEIARRLDDQGPLEVRGIVPVDGDIVVTELVPLQYPHRPAGTSGETLWGRLAPGESPPEPLTPLSRHLVVERSIERLERALGAEAPRSSRVLGAIITVRGRPYLDLSLVEQRARPVEPEGLLSKFEVAGAQWAPDLTVDVPSRISLPRLGLRLAQVATEQRALSEEVARFERDADQGRRWIAEMDLAILPDDALGTTLFEGREFLSRVHRLHAQATASVVSAHALVTSLVRGAEPARAPSLAHAMTAGSGVATSRLAAAFCHLAGILRLDPAALAHGVVADLPLPPELLEGPFGRAFHRFLDAYGDRGLVEGELFEPRFAEAPHSILSLLRATLRGSPVDPDLLLGQSRAGSERVLAEVSARLSFFEARLLRDLVQRLRELVRLRERCRAQLAHGLSHMRTVALDVDRRLRRLDPSLEEGSAFLLGLEELSVALRLYRMDLGPLVRARRADFQRERAAAAPPPVFRGTPHVVLPAVESRVVPGIAASPGIVAGRVVRIGSRLEGLEDFAPGDIVVVRSLDLSLSPIYFHAAAVVAELGTPLSSAAVVARDAGVTVVTGARGAWATLRSGSQVRVDGDAGAVEVLEPGPA